MRARERRGRRWWFMAALGALVLLSGVAFHAFAAYHRPGGDRPLSGSYDWAFFSWGWLRLAAWGAVAGGAWVLAAAWTRRPGTTG